MVKTGQTGSVPGVSELLRAFLSGRRFPDIAVG